MSDITATARSQGSVAGHENEVAKSLIGRGIAFFPFERHPDGAVALTRGDDVGESIRMIIMTAPGERVMRPEFGCAIWDHMFAPINAATLGQMAHAVRGALARWEPRIDVDEVRVSPHPTSPSQVDISIDYTISTSNDSRNLVFPFYVLPEEGDWP